MKIYAEYYIKIYLNRSPNKTGKIKQYLYMPVHARGVPEGWGSHISWQSAHEGDKFVSPRRQPPLPPGNIPGTNVC